MMNIYISVFKKNVLQLLTTSSLLLLSGSFSGYASDKLSAINETNTAGSLNKSDYNIITETTTKEIKVNGESIGQTTITVNQKIKLGPNITKYPQLLERLDLFKDVMSSNIDSTCSGEGRAASQSIPGDFLGKENNKNLTNQIEPQYQTRSASRSISPAPSIASEIQSAYSSDEENSLKGKVIESAQQSPSMNPSHSRSMSNNSNISLVNLNEEITEDKEKVSTDQIMLKDLQDFVKGKQQRKFCNFFKNNYSAILAYIPSDALISPNEVNPELSSGDDKKAAYRSSPLKAETKKLIEQYSSILFDKSLCWYNGTGTYHSVVEENWFVTFGKDSFSGGIESFKSELDDIVKTLHQESYIYVYDENFWIRYVNENAEIQATSYQWLSEPLGDYTRITVPICDETKQTQFLELYLQIAFPE